MFAWLQRLFSSLVEKSMPAPTPPIEEVAHSPAIVPAKKMETLESGTGPSWEQRSDANANFYNWLFATNSTTNDNADFDTSPAEKEILHTLDQIVKSKQSGANLVRRMPGLVPQLLQSLRSENFSTAELSRKLSHDVVLVEAVIRLANSSFTGTGQTINSIEHAVLIIGQSGLRQLITGVAFKPIIDLNSGHYTKTMAPRIWEQSERCAVANRMLAADVDVDPFEAFLAGLIQNVGLVVSLRIMDNIAKNDASLGSPTFCTSLLRYARTLSCSIGREWNFSEAVTHAIEEQGKVYNTALMSPLGKVLSLGDYLSKVGILVDNDRLTEGDPRVLKELSAKAIKCYRALGISEQTESADSIKN